MISKYKLFAAVLGILIAGNSLLSMHSSAEDTYGKFSAQEDVWKFTNSRKYFLSGDYYLSDDDRQILMQNLKNTEKWSARKFDQLAFGGVCYGMSVLSLLACYDLIDYEKYCTPSGSPTSLWDLNSDTDDDAFPSQKQQSLIDYYQRMQVMDTIRQYTMWGLYTTTEEERLQMLVDRMQAGIPTVLILTNYSDGSAFAHAVVAYGLQKMIPSAPSSNGYNGQILIYDPNYPGQGNWDYLYYKKNDWSWNIPSYFSSDAGVLMPLLEDIHLLNQGGLLGGTDTYIAENPFMDVFVTNALDSTHVIQQIDLYTDGSWTAKDTSMDYCQETAPYYWDASESAEVNFLLPGEEYGYVFAVENSQELDTAMYYENSIQHIYAGNASQLVCDPSGYVEFSGETAPYELEMIFNEGYYSGSWYDLYVSGSAQTAKLQKVENGYLLSADNLDHVKIFARNDHDISVLSFSSDADSVLLSESNEGILSADGVESLSLGNLNGDQFVNAQDAAILLKASANIGSGNASGLTSTQRYAADINFDGSFNAQDVDLILKYSTSFGSGSFSGTLTEFLESNR